MITIEPPSSSQPVLTTEHILETISRHAKDTAILLLPGIQFYTGQFLDIPTITKFARSQGIFVIWDLAHAVGNVPLQLHDWDVDAAAWCSYKVSSLFLNISIPHTTKYSLPYLVFKCRTRFYWRYLHPHPTHSRPFPFYL